MSGAWNGQKVAAFRDSFYEFVNTVKINSKELGGNTVLGEHIYRAQQMFLDGVFDALRDDVHEIYVLKSRQLGISTVSRALSLFWLGIHEGLQGAMVFDTSRNTQAARREIVAMIDSLPKSLRFPRIKDNNREFLILENDSTLSFLAAGVKDAKSAGGLARSIGLNFVHASEISGWVNDEGIVSLRQSLSNAYPDRLFIWESTARGYNKWHNLWEEAEADDLGKRTVFIGWWARDDQSIEEGTAEFSRYGTEPPTQKEIARIAAVRDLYGWQVMPQQLAWYRKKVDPTQELDDDDPTDPNLTQEQPWTAEEAWQATGSTFFQADKLNAILASLSSAPRPQYFKFWPGMDFITSDIKRSTTRREIEFRMWEEPVADSRYVVAADPAFGHNEENNNSCAQVMRCFADSIEQVGEYASATIEPHQFSWLLWTLIGYYGSKPNSQVEFIVELNGPGEEVWRQFQSTRQLIQQGYLRTAAREKGIGDIVNNVRSYVYNRSDSMGNGHNFQMKTNTQIKVQLMEACRNYLHNGVLLVRSPEAIEEMRTITRSGDKIEAEGAARDDRTIALGYGVRAWDQSIRRAMIAGNRTREAERAKLSLSIEDQFNLFRKNHLADFFKKQATSRAMSAWEMQRQQWRSGIGVRRPQIGRRW